MTGLTIGRNRWRLGGVCGGSALLARVFAMVVAVACCLMGVFVFCAGSALALESGPRWMVTAVSAPTNFAPGDVSGEDLYRVQVTNVGGESSDGPVTISDELPAGLSLASTGASGIDELTSVNSGSSGSTDFDCVLDTCTYTGVVAPEDTLILSFPVDVSIDTPTLVNNVVRVAGGGAADASVTTPTKISSTPAGFGISPGGASNVLSSTQAGAHPDITTAIAFNTVTANGSLAGEPKDVTDDLPPGFAADFIGVPTCPAATFSLGECPVDTQLGIATEVALIGSTAKRTLTSQPVYNLSPNPGEVAKFGFSIAGNFNVQGNVSVRPGDYGGRVAFHDIDEAVAEVDSTSLTVWGVPAAAVHNTWRWKAGTEGQGHFGTVSEVAPAPYFTNPTSCEEPLETKLTATSWGGEEAQAGLAFSPMIVGCDRLGLPASFTAVPNTERAEAPTGLDAELKVLQTYENPEGLATSALKKAVVTLPEGMTVNPSAGAGLSACSEAQYEEEALEAAVGRGCPNESKLGSVTIETPVLTEKATGSVYLAQPYANPFPSPGHPGGSLIGLYVVARFADRGILVKVAGKVIPNETTGQLETVFEAAPSINGTRLLGGLPPVPFSTFTFKFLQGPTSPLVSPPVCGSYAASTMLTPWSEPALLLTPELVPFKITQGVNGAPCPSGGVPPFDPQLVAGTSDNDAGAYSPFSLKIARNDGEQELTRFSMTMPPALTGNLSGIPYCSEAQIEAARVASGAEELANPSCPVASEIGQSVAEAGVGTVLAQTPGKIYLAGPYHGAPFSVVSVTSAKVGPFDLGTVVIRFALRINLLTAQVEIDGSSSDAIPHIIDGIVVHVRNIRVSVSRNKFIINPTSCAPTSIVSTIVGAGANYADPADQVPVTVTTPFQAADCANLAFKPTLSVTAASKSSRANGTTVTFKVSYPQGAIGTQAWLKSAKLDIPKQLPARLSTLQKSCTAATFNTNPGSCPTGSRIGTALVHTQILPVPLEGPVYFVSNGGLKFPEAVMVLQGDGVTVDVHAETFINEKTSVTSATLRAIPGVPFENVTVTLPSGKYSEFTAIGNLCHITKTTLVKKKITVKDKGHKKTVTHNIKKTVASTLTMPAAFTGQNGKETHENPTIKITECRPKTKTKTTKTKKKTGKKTKKTNQR